MLDGPAVERAASRAAAPTRLTTNGFDVIAEVKLRSPADGAFDASPADVASISEQYERSGAAALSVLTEPARFSGDIAHLETAARHVPAPVMRKDFLVHPKQVLEARANGASGVLLIARLLDSSGLEAMTDLALDLGMFVLVEVFDPRDLALAEEVLDRDVLLGVNCRDLATLEVRFERLEEMATELPRSKTLVAESGVTDPHRARLVAEMGYQMALVGSALMRSANPTQLLREMIQSGRSATVEVAS